MFSSKLSLNPVVFSLTLLLLSGCGSNQSVLHPSTKNLPPVAQPDSYDVVRGRFFAVKAVNGVLQNDSDPEGQDLAVSLSQKPEFGTVQLNADGSFSYEPEGTEAKRDTFGYLLSDGELSSVTTVSLTIITPPVEAPVANADSYSLQEGETLQVSAEPGLLANDQYTEENLVLEPLTQPEHGQLVLNADGSFRYQHDHSEPLEDSFVYQLSTAKGVAQAKVSLNISPVDDAPVIARLELAQTHVIAPEGKRWEAFPEDELHLVGDRESLVLVSFANMILDTPQLEGLLEGESLGILELNDPTSLPKTEANGRPYSQNSYWVMMPASWLKPGLELRFIANDGQLTKTSALNVGASSSFSLYTLPFYLFGADESLVPFSLTAEPDEATRKELYAKWPVAELEVVNHPAKKVEWEYIIVGPRQGRAAQRVTYKEQQGDGYAVMSAVLDTLGAVRSANGDGPTGNQYYAPLLMATQTGSYGAPGGGLGGGHLGTGDYAYSGVFIHEQGHAFGIPHVGDAYNAGNWPYVGGSLSGSSWGFDSTRLEFLDIRVPPTSSAYKNCATKTFAGNPRQLDEAGFCIKQDPMQSGAGDSDSSYRFSLFSDFSTARMQRYFEGQTSSSSGNYSYKGGRVFVDANSSTGYSRWNSLEAKLEPVEPKTVDGGLYGLDAGLPQATDVPVHTLIVTYSNAATEGVSQIYRPLSYVGNLRRLLDPTKAGDRQAITPNTGENYWYCRASGCDYSLRVSFGDDSVQNIVLQGAFRKWFSSAEKDGILEPSSSDSFRIWGVNVPGDKAIKQVELLSTPEVWTDFPDEPAVLLSCGYKGTDWGCK